MRRRFPSIFAFVPAVLLAGWIAPAWGLDRTPLPVSDRNPLTQIFGLPPFGSATPLARGRGSTEVAYEVANFMYYNSHADETLVLDGEVHRLTLRLTRGTDWGEWGLEIPYLSHDAGYMDGLISRWHDLFGMPQGGRDRIADYQFIYRYAKNGSDLLHLTQSSEGVGDLRLYGGWALRRDAAVDLALRTSLKLPSGNADGLRGSGAADLALSISAACGIHACPDRWSWTAGAGILWLGRGEVLPDLQRRAVVFGETSVLWNPWTPVTFKAGFYGHGAFYRGTDVEPMGQTSIQLIVGGSWAISNGTVMDVAVSEDVRINTAADVGLMISLRSLF
jgi:hypothetical protein